jgi:hypothetical protein
MNEKMAVVTIAGRASGSMTWRKIPYGEQPSILAASSSSAGIPRMNCTMRNTKNASVANSLGTISGNGVSIQPRNLNSTNCGTIRTWWGSSRVAMTNANHMPRSGKRSRANANAVTTHDAQLATTTPAAMTRLLMKNREKFTVCIPVQPRA